jgi:predicted PurR-regulated permease PerM
MDEPDITTRRAPNRPAPVVVGVRHDLPRTTFGVLVMVGLIAACLWILRPFLPALLWSATIVVATWPVMLKVQHKLWHKRWLAVTVMTTALVLAFVVPFTLAIGTLVDNADEIASWVGSISKAQLPELPRWVTKLPFLLTLIISAIFYAYGEAAVLGLRAFFRRIAGARGEEVVELSGQAIRGVAFGVVVTALVQSIMGGIGLAIAGIPLVGLLTALMFILAVAQIGAAPIIFAAAAWAWWQGQTGWAIGLAVWATIVGSMDNILRPILIRRGGHLPLLLVFAGVIGGLVAFGLVGIFVGPLVLAVAYRLLEAWVKEASTPPVV